MEDLANNRWPPTRTSLYLSAMRQRLQSLSSDDLLLLSPHRESLASPHSQSESIYAGHSMFSLAKSPSIRQPVTNKSECFCNQSGDPKLLPRQPLLHRSSSSNNSLQFPMLRLNVSIAGEAPAKGNAEALANSECVYRDLCNEEAACSNSLPPKMQCPKAVQQNSRNFKCSNVPHEFYKNQESSDLSWNGQWGLSQQLRRNTATPDKAPSMCEYATEVPERRNFDSSLLSVLGTSTSNSPLNPASNNDDEVEDDNDSLLLSLSSFASTDAKLSEKDVGSIHLPNFLTSYAADRATASEEKLLPPFPENYNNSNFNFRYYNRERNQLLKRIHKAKLKAHALALRLSR